MSSFQEDLADWVTQTSVDETAFKLPFAYRVITLILSVIIASVCIWAVFFSGDQIKVDFGVGGIILCLVLLYSSVPRELHLNFQTRTYRKVFGFGPFAFRQSGPFSDITSVYLRRKGRGERVPSMYAALEFKKPQPPQKPMPLPLDWHLVSTEPTKEPALKKYAGDLAAKIKVPMEVRTT